MYTAEVNCKGKSVVPMQVDLCRVKTQQHYDLASRPVCIDANLRRNEFGEANMQLCEDQCQVALTWP